MKKKYLLLLFLLSITLYGCSSNSSVKESAPIIQEVESLSDADIIIPSALVGDEIDILTKDKIQEANPIITTSEVSSDETSASTESLPPNTTKLSLTGEERTTIVNDISSELLDSIQAILDNDDYYPNVVAITPNINCSEFTISLENGTMNLYESMLVMSFYSIGDKYQIYAGVSEPVTVVKFINAQTNEVISESTSDSMNTYTE